MKRPFFTILLAVAVSHTLVSLSRFRLWLRNKAMPTTILINGKIVSMDD